MIEYPFEAGKTLTRVLESGSGERSLVFIHGLGARADRWRRNLEAFAAAGFHCYALDLPGHGFAVKGEGFPYGVSGYTDFVTEFLDAMGISSTAFVGTSLGGHISATFTCRHPDRVRALVLVGSVGLVPIGAEAGEAIRQSVRETSREAIAQKLDFVIADSALVTPEWIEEEYRINNSPGARESFMRLGDYVADKVDSDTVIDALKDLVATIPIMLVWGAEDKAVPLALGEKAKALLGGVPLLALEGAGHAPYFENPYDFNESVLDFLAGSLKA